MAKNNIGGYFVELSLMPDMPSFDTGNKLIDNLSSKYNNLIGIMRNAATISGETASAEFKTAQVIGMSAQQLEIWKTAAKQTNVNADALISSIGKLSSVMGHLQIDGRGLEQYSKTLTELGLNFAELDGMDPESAIKKILGTATDLYNGATTAEGRRDVVTRVSDVLGGEMANFFSEMMYQGLDINGILEKAAASVYTTNEDRDNAHRYQLEKNELESKIENLNTLLGDKVAGALVPAITNLNDFLDKNKDPIIKLVDDLSKSVGTVAEKLTTFLNWKYGDGKQSHQETLDRIGVSSGSTLAFLLQNPDQNIWALLDGATDKEIEQYMQELQLAKSVRSIMKGNKRGKNDILDASEINDKTIDIIRQYLEAGGTYDSLPLSADAPQKLAKYGINRPQYVYDGWADGIEDGIMRPDGTVTKVAPDDWVFAARNVEDLAAAFIPQNHTGAGPIMQNYTINQEFTIGATNDMPQVIRQQAYRGAQEGLMEAMAQSSQRLQLMSGTR